MKISVIIAASLAAVLLLTVGLLGVLRIRESSRTNRLRGLLRTAGEPRSFFSPKMVEGLPGAAQRYLLHALSSGAPLARHVELRMRGRIKPSGAWMPFEAEQTLSLSKGFIWKAQARKGLMSVQVTDHYLAQEGRMRVALFGLIPLVNSSGPEIARSAAGRFLGECVWLPSALLPLHGAVWEEVDDTHARVTLEVDSFKTTLTLTLDPKGRLKEVVFPRWKDGEEGFVPFRVVIEEESTFGSITIPSVVRAGWWYGTARYAEFFRATIEDAVFH